MGHNPSSYIHGSMFGRAFGGGTGWTLYPPLSTSFMSLSVSSTAYLIFGLLMSGISSCLTSVNFWVTILNLRSYCLTLKTMPLFPWALLITAAMLLLTLPVLSGALLMVIADLHSNTLFFDPVFGGDPVLYQHLFWFFWTSRSIHLNNSSIWGN